MMHAIITAHGVVLGVFYTGPLTTKKQLTREIKMLKDHPHIKRLRFQESVVAGRMNQTLIVETDIDLSDTRSELDKKELNHLQNYLRMIAINDFADFNSIEIRPHQSAYSDDDYGNNMIA